MSAFNASVRTAARFVGQQAGQFALGAAQGAAGYGHIQTGPPTAAGGLGTIAGQTARDRYQIEQANRREAFNARQRFATRTVSQPAAAIARTQSIGTRPDTATASSEKT